MKNSIKRYICKFCKCPVVSKEDLHPLFGEQHGKKCPRRWKYQ